MPETTSETDIVTTDSDFGRKVSAGLLEAIERASRYSEPVTLDCSAAADVHGEIISLRSALEAARAVPSLVHSDAEIAASDGSVIYSPELVANVARAIDAEIHDVCSDIEIENAAHAAINVILHWMHLAPPPDGRTSESVAQSTCLNQSLPAPVLDEEAIRADERENCAKLAENTIWGTDNISVREQRGAEKVAAAIRRGPARETDNG